MKLIFGENIKNQIRNFLCVDVSGFEPFFSLCCFVTFIYLFLFLSRFRLFGAFPRLFWALGLFYIFYLFIYFFQGCLGLFSSDMATSHKRPKRVLLVDSVNSWFSYAKFLAFCKLSCQMI